jgi:N-glycosylase/DNA lyase
VPAPPASVLLTLPPQEPFDPEPTFRCGQAFRWREHEGAWYGPYGNGSLRLLPVRGGYEVSALGCDPDRDGLARFLGFGDDLSTIHRELSADPALAAALSFAPGLRLLRQDPWECLVGYLCSQWNNVPRIEGMLERLAVRWGEEHRWPDGPVVASLPPPDVLARVSEQELRSLGFGYRARYVLETARRIRDGEPDLAALRELEYSDALRILLSLPGVGRKVADCVLLFSLDQPGACPVDVWVRRVMLELYGDRILAGGGRGPEPRNGAMSAGEYEAIAHFARERWGRRAGYAQQYLFHARRSGAPIPGVGNVP